LKIQVLLKKKQKKQKKTTSKQIGGDGVCDCSLGDLLDDMKLFRPLYVIKHKLIDIYVTMRGLFK
jgi:hypothetical protein